MNNLPLKIVRLIVKQKYTNLMALAMVGIFVVMIWNILLVLINVSLQ